MDEKEQVREWIKEYLEEKSLSNHVHNGIDFPLIPTENLAISDTTINNVTSSNHGFAPKSPADATKFLNGAATPTYALVKDSDLSTSDITTNDVTTSKHGFVPKAPNDTTKFLRGDATWAVGGAICKSGVTDRTGASGTGNFTIAHGLGVTPKLVVLHFNVINTGGSVAISFGTGHTFSTTGADNNVGYTIVPSGATNMKASNNSSKIYYAEDGAGTALGYGVVVGLDATNITISATYVSGTWDMTILWEAFA